MTNEAWGKLERVLAAIRKRLHGDQTPGEYYKPEKIYHSALEPSEQRSWIRPHGPRKQY
jgi:hypothetical protein